MKQTPQIKLVRKSEWRVEFSARRRALHDARCQLGGSGQGACAKTDDRDWDRISIR